MIKKNISRWFTSWVNHIQPMYFKMGSLINIDDTDVGRVMNSQIDDNYPIRSTGDGVTTNSKVGHVFWDQSVLHTPKYCYSAHTAFWNIKRLAPPKSMKVTKKTVFYENLHTAVKHFESSVKYKELLDDALKILIVKPLHLTSW